MAQEFTVLGKPVPNMQALGNVTGTTQYVDDISLPGMLWIKALRSPVPRGRIKRLDTSKAERIPGVERVLTWRDVPKNVHITLWMLGVGPPDEPLLAEDEVNYRGEPICLVVARDEETALRAVREIDLEIEELPPVLSMEEALRPGAPIIKKWGTNTFTYGTGMDGISSPGRREGRPYFLLKRGDVDEAFRKADHIVEGSYVIPPIEHAPLETHICVAKPEPGGRITIYSNSQAPYFVRSNVADVLQIEESRIRVINCAVGGGFGGKNDCEIEQLTALAALKVGRPVKWRWTREEEFMGSSTRDAVKTELRDAVTRDGYILGRYARLLHDAGAYSRFSPYAVVKSLVNLTGPYHIPNVRFEGYCVYTNRQPSSSMRGYGVFEVSYAVELHMERIARTIGMDPWEFRFKNAYRRGQVSATGKIVEDAALIEVMREAAALAGIRLPQHLLEMSSG